MLNLFFYALIVIFILFASFHIFKAEKHRTRGKIEFAYKNLGDAFLFFLIAFIIFLFLFSLQQTK